MNSVQKLELLIFICCDKPMAGKAFEGLCLLEAAERARPRIKPGPGRSFSHLKLLRYKCWTFWVHFIFWKYLLHAVFRNAAPEYVYAAWEGWCFYTHILWMFGAWIQKGTLIEFIFLWHLTWGDVTALKLRNWIFVFWFCETVKVNASVLGFYVPSCSEPFKNMYLL